MRQKGFTLVELLVVSGIVIFLSGIVLVNYRAGDEDFRLQRSAHKLAQDIRRAGEMAMSAREFQGSFPEGGYGVQVKLSENTSYILYADKNGNETFDGQDGEVERIFFEKGVFIKSLSKNNLSVNFRPPQPKIAIIGGSSSASITLALKSDPAKTRIIEVNAAGLIEVE